MQLFRILLHGWRRRACYGTPPEQQERRALTWYFASTLLGTLMSLFGKLCASAGMHFFLLVCVRSSVLCLLVAPLLWRRRLNPFALNEA